jgi:hypothetical protein
LEDPSFRKSIWKPELMLVQGYEGMTSAESSFAGDRVRHERAAGEWIVQLYSDWGNRGRPTSGEGSS